MQCIHGKMCADVWCVKRLESEVWGRKGEARRTSFLSKVFNVSSGQRSAAVLPFVFLIRMSNPLLSRQRGAVRMRR